ncbi:MAG: DUF1015 family protein [Actinomycetota bacterium]
MPRISPFVGLCFDRSRVGDFERVTAPPYDVISTEEHGRFLASSPFNVIRLDLGHEPGRAERPERYTQAAADLAAWRNEGVLRLTEGEAYFPYEMRFSLHGRRRRIRGLVCAVELEDWDGGIVPHERTMPGPVRDRLRLVRSVAANLSCIYSIFPGPNRTLEGWLSGSTAGAPHAELTDRDGVEHRMWIAPPDPDVERWFHGETLMIADGHHRYATALRYRDEMRATHGPGPWDATMMFLVDAGLEDPPVLPFHRIQVAGAAPADGVRVRDLGEVLESVDDGKLVVGTAAREDGGLVHRVVELAGLPPAVSRLHETTLSGLDHAIRFTADAVAAEEAVRSGRAVAAYFLPATDAGTIRSVVDGGDRLPQKSTFFWPKPRTGLVLRPHDTA